MIQDYFLALLDWCRVNFLLWDRKPNIVFKEGEIWWCSIGLNVGVEIWGKGKYFSRPVLILKKLSADSFLAIPLTSQKKKGSWYVPIVHGRKERTAILSQVRVLDIRRLTKRIGVLGFSNFQNIRDAFLKFYSS